MIGQIYRYTISFSSWLAKRFCRYYKAVVVSLLSLLLSPHSLLALDASQAAQAIKDRALNKAINTAEQLINTKANELVSQFGQGQTSIQLQGIESDDLSYSIETIQPLTDYRDDIDQLTYLQGSIFSAVNEGERRPTLNLGLGQRYLSTDQQSILGANLFLDYEGKSAHKRGSVGLEYLRSNFGLGFNRYHPISNETVIGDYVEKPIAGYDINVSGQVPYLPWATIKGSRHHWDRTRKTDIDGYDLGVEVSLSDNSRFELGQTNNNETEAQSYGKLTLQLPFDGEGKVTKFTADKQAFRNSTMLDLTTLKPTQRQSKINLEKWLNYTGPVFTSSNSADVNEGQTNAITLTAKDTKGSVSYGINGTDAALFNLDTSTGVVSFKQAPDYETPIDANNDNTYVFTATVTGSYQLFDTQTVSINVQDVEEQQSLESDPGTNPGTEVEPIGQLTITPSSTSVNVVSGLTNTYTLNLNKQPDSNLTITPETANSVISLSGPVTFTPDDWSAKTITITAADNEITNNNNTAVITHTISGDYANLTIADVQVNIVDSSTISPGFILTSPSNNAQTSESRSTAYVDVKLSTQPTDTVSIAYHTSNSKEGLIIKDYDDPSSKLAISSTIHFSPDNWNTFQRIGFVGVNDHVDDDDVTYHIIFGDAVSEDLNYDKVNPGNIEMTNIDNDTAEIIATPMVLTTTEDPTDTNAYFTVRLNTEPTGFVFFNLNSEDTTEGTINESTMSFNQDDWDITKYVIVNGQPDNEDDGNVTYNITITPNTIVTTDAKYAALEVVNISVTNVGYNQNSDDRYNTVTSPHTGKVWLDRNVGADQVCTSLNDSACYGNLYQWGRNHDGHELRTQTATTVGPINSLSPNSSNIITSSNTPYDWTSVDDDGSKRRNSWGSASTGSAYQHVCPAGFRVPTVYEFINEFEGNNDDAMGSFLNIPYAGYRDHTSEIIYDAGQGGLGYFWTTTTNPARPSQTVNVFFDDDWRYGLSVNALEEARASSLSVRCIQN